VSRDLCSSVCAFAVAAAKADSPVAAPTSLQPRKSFAGLPANSLVCVDFDLVCCRGIVALYLAAAFSGCWPKPATGLTRHIGITGRLSPIRVLCTPFCISRGRRITT
jgi:hypothetical protein